MMGCKHSAGSTRYDAKMAHPLEKLFFQAAEVFAETLWPTRCAVCDLPGYLLCERCRSQLKLIDTCKACRRCGAPFGRIQCTECNKVMLDSNEREDIPFDAMAHAVILDDAARRIVTSYKDKGDRRLVDEMAAYAAHYLNPSWIDDDCAISFIPATSEAVRRRGFDHAEELATSISMIAGIECVPLFARPRSSDQRALSRKQRFKNMSKQMEVLDGSSVPTTVIVIDDVCTTGSTLYTAADALRAANVEHLYALTFGRVI